MHIIYMDETGVMLGHLRTERVTSSTARPQNVYPDPTERLLGVPTLRNLAGLGV